jgi:hypothetical protein
VRETAEVFELEASEEPPAYTFAPEESISVPVVSTRHDMGLIGSAQQNLSAGHPPEPLVVSNQGSHLETNQETETPQALSLNNGTPGMNSYIP